MTKHLYDSIAARWLRDTGTVWVISDPHFGDPESAAMRGDYPGDDALVKMINAKVGKKDTIIILGDVGDIEYIKKLRGYKVLVMGNHDKGASNYRRDYGQYHLGHKATHFAINSGTGPFDFDTETCYETKIVTDRKDNHLFDEVYEGPLMVSDRLILSHEPIYPLPPYMYNIHGHVHSRKEDDAQHKNVCAEHVGYTPVNLIGMLKDGLLSAVDSIHESTIERAARRKRNAD